MTAPSVEMVESRFWGVKFGGPVAQQRTHRKPSEGKRFLELNTMNR